MKARSNRRERWFRARIAILGLGLMAMAGWGTDNQEALTQFHAVRELRDRLQQEFGIPLQELSMGMSGDYPQAIEAGATMVRIGSALFKGVI